MAIDSLAVVSQGGAIFCCLRIMICHNVKSVLALAQRCCRDHDAAFLLLRLAFCTHQALVLVFPGDQPADQLVYNSRLSSSLSNTVRVGLSWTALAGLAGA